MLRPCRLLLWQLALKLSYHVVTATLCMGASDIFVSIRENSPMGQFISILSIAGEPGTNTVRLCLTGDNADWFYIEGRTIRLNTPASKVLDREVLGPVLIAQLTCSEDGVQQSQYRILVEILNENDNRPNFLEETADPFTVSELAAVDSVVLTVKALDADGDTITYIIDDSSPDALFFRIDLPNSGKVVLDKPLDYETRTQLQVVIWAEETNTADKFNTSAVLTVNIEDADDQYPHFLPCTPVSSGVPVCMSPTYTANITHKQQEAALDFSPGPIRAVDGDRGINTTLVYSILSGEDGGRFVINNRTGEIRSTRAVSRRQLMTNFTLVVMVCQENDRHKYSVAPALVRVLSENMFPPVFNRTTFKGFIIQSSSPASIVSTYGNQVLQVQVSDDDFSDGVNPNIHYSLHPLTGLYQVTRQGVLIARTDRLHAFNRHILQVVARDEESGEEVSASVDMEVLQRGQAVPRGAFKEQQLFGDMDSRLAGGVGVTILLLFLCSVLFVMLRTIRRRRGQRNPPGQSAAAAAAAAAARGQHPNVVSSSRPVFSMEEVSYSNRGFREDEPSSPSEGVHGRQGVYTRRQSLLPPASSSSSSNIIISDPQGRTRLRSDLVPVIEKPEGPPEPTETPGTFGSSDVKEGLRATGGSTGVPGDDITAVNSETPQRDDDIKTDQSEKTLLQSEDQYR